MIYRLIFITFLSVYSFANDTIYFLPKQADEVKSEIISLINNAQKTVDVVVYSFDDKKLVNALKKAAKNDIDVTVIYGKSKLKFHKKINQIIPKRKQHIKLAIIDNKIAIFGSANWKKESFGKNYEIINITDEKEKVERFKEIIKQIKKEN